MKVNQKLETVQLYELEGAIDVAIVRLQALCQKYNGKTIKLDLQTCPYDDTNEYHVVWEREETADEIAKRSREEASQKEYRRKQYESLKKEFEDQL